MLLVNTIERIHICACIHDTRGMKTSKAPRLKTTRMPEADDVSGAQRVAQRIEAVGGWRGETLARVRALILEAAPGVEESCKWIKPSNPLGVPVWSQGGILCTGEVYAKAVKLTFAKGALVKDPAGLFNASLEGNARRAIDIAEGEVLNARAFKALIRAAVAVNASSSKASAKTPRLLSGGNPQIPKGDGEAPVQAYIAAMPGWKQDVGRWLDKVITESVPNVTKAVRWNSPFYGVEGDGYFLGFHVLTRTVKVAFMRGTSLKPMPPGASKTKEARYLDIHEGDVLDEAQLRAWVKQAAALPGWKP